MKKKDVELKYESVERVSRWNLCQQLASAVYNSMQTNKKIKESILNVYRIGQETHY